MLFAIILIDFLELYINELKFDIFLIKGYHAKNFQERQKMKKSALTILILIFLLFSQLPAQNSAANEEYIKAITTKDANQRAQQLKQWLTKYSGKGQQNENFANATLCNDNYNGKTPDDMIKFGEKALSLGGLDDLTKSKVLLNVAAIYIQKGSGLSKAKNHTNQLIQTAQAAKKKPSEADNTKVWNQMIGAGYFIQAQALEKTNDAKGALNAYTNSYNILKNKQIITAMAKLGKTLYDTKAYTDAEKAFKLALPVMNDYGIITLLAKSLHRSGKKDEALKYYKQSYNQKKTGEIAYNIGILLAPQANGNSSKADEAINYFLAASFLSPANTKKAMEYAQGLYFSQNPQYNEKVKALQTKNKNLVDLSNSFNNKFGEKDEEDLSDPEKKEMEKILSQIDSLQKEIEKTQAEQQSFLDKFDKLIAQKKQELGIQ